MQICQEVYFLFFSINFFKRDAKEWEGISGLVSEPCNSKAFGKLLKAFKKISNSLRSDSEIFLHNADFLTLIFSKTPANAPQTIIFFTRHLDLVMEQSDTSKTHHHSIFIASLDHSIITHRSTRLRNILHTTLMRTLDIIPKWEECI